MAHLQESARESGRMPMRVLRRLSPCLFAAVLALFVPTGSALAQAASCPSDLATTDLIDHQFSVSYCELCGTGRVRIEIENPFRDADDADFSEIVITEDLGASGLTYVSNSTNFTADNQGSPPDVEPVVNGSQVTWTLPSGYELQTRPNGGGGGSIHRLVLDFEVESLPGQAEALVDNDRRIRASVDVTPSCDPAFTLSNSTSLGELPLREPEPEIVLTGRNVDAGQGAGQYADTVYGHEGDDIIWRAQVFNRGDADLQDFIFTKDMQPGNFTLRYVCDSESDASSAANGGGSGSCVAISGTQYRLDTRALFGGGANPYVVAPAGGSGNYYFVGEMTDSCVNRSTEVRDAEWGCEAEAPAGGILETSNNVPALLDAADLSALSNEQLNVDVDFIGAYSGGQPVGSKGRVRIRITNNSGGTIRGDLANGLQLRNLLPAEYVVDPTFIPTARMAPAYGNAYDGMLDTVAWINPESGTVPYTASTPNAAALANTEPRFEVTSSTQNSEFAEHRNLLRHGDTLTIIFGVVLVDDQYYDREAELEDRQEAPGGDFPNTDPTQSFQVQNELQIWYEDFCANGGTDHNDVWNTSHTANPEDIDPDVAVDDPVYILTNDDVLPLTVELNNNGGHAADDYFAYVTFGNAMTVVGAPGSCSVVSNPPTPPTERTVWQDPTPVALPASGTVYRCSPGRIGPGQTRSLTFDVEKNDAAVDDDLTFRADVIGEITLSDGTPLRFPAPIARGDGVVPDYNNYTVDTLWWRVVGYNLIKAQRGICTENQAAAGNPDDEIQIGEECQFSIESGGWFGFDTIGFNYIAVQDIRVVDNIPDGQGYISDTDPFAAGYSTSEIQSVSFNPPPLPLDEAPFDWTHNGNIPAERISARDEWFRVDVTTRMLNDPQDVVGPPNEHAAQSSNILTSTFQAVFESQLTGDEVTYDLDPNTYGYPPEFRRRVDLTVTEPNLIVTQEVCNETLYGAGPGCTNFVPLADDGDAYDTYIYRVTVENEPAAGGVPRAPAYDVTITTDTDPTDLVILDPLESDGLDNDGNAEIDEAAGEGQIVPDNEFLNGTPAQIITDYTHSDALLRIDAGDSVVFYYRVDPYDDVAPLQTLTNSAVATYDSLEGPTGNQTDPVGANGEIGGARQYTSAPGDAAIRIIPVEVEPKQILELSNTPKSASPGPQPVSVGEEIEFELRTLIPVAQLRNFVVRDELPAGMRCSEAPVVDLDAPPYDAGVFVPGGAFTPICTETEVIWDFGNQKVTQTEPGQTRFDFGIQFIARIDNVEPNVDGTVIGNGGAYTTTNVSYIDELDNPVVIDFEAAEVVVREPQLELTKEFSVEETDAGDTLTVTVTATNIGTATAYNPRFFDDLTAVDLSYAGNVGGADPPQVDTTTYGDDSPLFYWDPGYAIAVGDQLSFTFEVTVDDLVEPLQVLENTIQGDWTSLPMQDTALNSMGSIGADGDVDGMRNGALPNAADVLNDYEAEASDSVYVSPLAFSKNDLDTAAAPAVGLHKAFEVQLDLPEGASNGVRLDDDLAFGNASYVFADNADFAVTYEFVGIAEINGQAPDAAAFNAVPADGASGTISWDVGSITTEVEDDTAVNDVNPYIRITYRARINNDLDTNVGNTLQNSATLYYTNGDTGGQESLNATTAAIQVIEPALTASKAIANVTPGKQPADPIELGDLVQYTLTIPNGGDSIAHDTNVTDTLPPELTLDTSYTPTAQIDGVDVPGFVAVPAGSPNGPLVWGAGNGDGSLDVAPGATLEITYQVILEAPADESVALTNIVWVDWTSLDEESVYERTGAGCPTVTAPDDYCYGPATADGTPFPVGPPQALVKANTQDTASIGEEFRYRITIPGAPHPLPLYDVRILDDLNASAADISFVDVVQVSGPGAFVLENNGDAKNLVIEDTATGIDIPVGQQVVIDVTVRLDDTAGNVAGLEFTNTASWTYNRLNDAPATELAGDPYTTQPMTIVEPDELVMTKSGPPQMQLGVPGTFTLDLYNVSEAPAHNATIYDLLPNQADGGTCDAAPENFAAQVFEADGTTPVSAVLAEGTDFEVVFAGEPDCTVTLTMLTPATAIGAGQRLILTYDAYLDSDSQQSASLTNVAGATEWFSIDVSDPDALNYARTYARALTDGTVGTDDHEDAHTVVVFTPLLVFEKTVVNLSSGEDPATVATPGERLRYTLRIENASDTPLDGFDIRDELDALNASPSFLPGSLVLLTYPDGADVANTDPNGGAAGTGLLDVRDLSLGGLGDSIEIEFQVDLAPVIANDSYVLNQSEALFAGYTVALSDDPYVNGVADPGVVDDEDPTQVLIQSAPAFTFEKTATYVEGDPGVLLAGETLRYTITAENVGTDNAADVEIFDQLPANVAYVTGSTTLNGAAVPDGNGGTLPLGDGILINAPQDTTPGVMNAGVADNVATVTFDVVVYPDVPDGTIIENQAFLNAVGYGIADQPSDDPRTEVFQDPTRDVVGNYPLLFATKTAALEVDLGSPGIVDPGDTLRYTITVYNNGAVAATDAELSDMVPADVTYVADTTTMNGLPVGQPDGGIFPLEAQIPISSADLTPPLPGDNEGMLSPGEAATIQFDMLVDADVPTGTLITNQAIVYSAETPNLLTDGDGDPATGPEPTVVVVGDAQQLSITKEVAVVGGGPAVAGATLEYTVAVQNIGAVPALYVLITDNLDDPIPGYLTYVADSALLNGQANGVTFDGTMLTADYFNEYGPLEPGENVILRFRATINPDLAEGTTISNTAEVSWNDPAQYASATITIDVGGVPNAGILSGNVWHDADFDDTLDPVELGLEGWSVTLLLDDSPVRTVQTAADGSWVIGNVVPNYGLGQEYSLEFTAPGAGLRTATLGVTDSDFTDGRHGIGEIEVQGGSNLRDLNLPIDPNGVVYDAVTRAPVAGATLTMLDARRNSPLPEACFDDPVQQGQITTPNGYYKFDLNFSDPACPSGANYTIEIVPPPDGYVPGPSELIPAATTAQTLPFDVPSCPASADDAVIGTGSYCEVQPSEFAPPASAPARSQGTVHHRHLVLNSAQAPGSSQLFNNHIPVDPQLGGAVAVTKTTPMLNVTRGQMVPYVITVRNSFGADLSDVNIVDRFPAGFHYVEGSARFDDVATEPALVGRELVWSDLLLAENGEHTIKLLLAVGAGVSEGEFTNRALAMNALTGGVMSEEAAATVRIVPDPTFDCTDVTGKVFDDANRNGYQDEGESGLAGVRLVTVGGLAATTDGSGRYHITCAITPDESRGSNFVLKLDDRTLPSGFRASTRPVQVVRATRGKALRVNFGASIHRVVGLDVADPVFEPGTVQMREQWTPRVGLLFDELRKGPAVLRISYLADVEDESLVEERLAHLKAEIMAAWEDEGCCYELVVEPEIFWRRGGPPDAARTGDR
jgi:uncharacterized repeat protein (TIGR01451 family)